MDRNAALKRTWNSNAEHWTAAVRGRRIPSRTAGTDRAIVDAVRGLSPGRVLDVGCGEGWLVRRLADEPGCDAAGIDGSAQLVANASAAHEAGSYRVLSYEDIVARPEAAAGPYDVIVCNFALLGESLTPILAALRRSLAADGALLIQTVHPWPACGDAPYIDGWREETFAAFGGDGWTPMPWYFRTIESWLVEIGTAGLRVTACREPVDADSRKPLSMIFTCRANS